MTALVLSRQRPFPWLAWASSILADADHFLWRIAQTGDGNPLTAWRYFTSEPDDGPRQPLLLHRYSVIAALWVGGRRIPALRQIAAGLAFHRGVDDATVLWHFGRRRWRQRNRERLRIIVFGRENYRCQECGSDGVALELHHRIAEADGGRNHPNNLLALCHECHDRAHGRATHQNLGSPPTAGGREGV